MEALRCILFSMMIGIAEPGIGRSVVGGQAHTTRTGSATLPCGI